ncbi:MAG: hypothetical protein JF590_02960 [Gemmatimonadetes bacterium]|nr:hypothetical protein [Gemmatimonadota bacterium]
MTLTPPTPEVRPELAHCNTMRFKLASAGAGSIPALVACWNETPHLRHGVVVTFGIMLWYMDNTDRTLTPEDRVIARRFLLRSAVAEERWLRQAFVEAADWTNDPTYLPLVLGIDPLTPTARKLEGELVVISSGDLFRRLCEQWDAMGAEAWVTDGGLQRSAALALGTAGNALSEDEMRTARAALTALVVNLAAAKGRGVRAEGYEVMKCGVETLSARLGVN